MNFDMVWKVLGIGWSLAAAVAAAAFFFGGEWSNWQKVKTRVLIDNVSGATPAELTTIRDELARLQKRVDGITLTAVDAPNSPSYGCGQKQTAESGSLVVMSGILDGTDCAVPNINFYKRLELSVPK